MTDEMTPQEESMSDFTKWRLDPEEIHDRVKHFLKNERWDSKSGEWVSDGEPLMNANGVNSVLNCLNMCVNKDTILSNLKESRLLFLCGDTQRALGSLIYIRARDFDVKKGSVNYIVKVVMNYIEIALKRCMDGGERDSIDKMEQIQRIYQQKGDKKGFWLFPRNKGGNNE